MEDSSSCMTSLFGTRHVRKAPDSIACPSVHPRVLSTQIKNCQQYEVGAQPLSSLLEGLESAVPRHAFSVSATSRRCTQSGMVVLGVSAIGSKTALLGVARGKLHACLPTLLEALSVGCRAVLRRGGESIAPPSVHPRMISHKGSRLQPSHDLRMKVSQF